MDQRRGRRTVHHGDRQQFLDRHVRLSPPHGERPGAGQRPYLGQLPRRQELYGRPAGARYDPVVERFELDEGRGDPAAVRLERPLDGGGVQGPLFTVHGNAISVDMSAYKRPTATGTIVDGSHISVTFPDDRTYTGVLQAPGTIHWSNNTSWTKFDTSVIKHLFVLMMENRSFDHMLGFQGIKGNDAHTGAPTNADDLTGASFSTRSGNMRYAVSPTAGDTTFGSHDVNHQFLDVLTQLCGHDAGETVKKANGRLNGSPYPPVAATADTGFADDYAASDPANPGEPMRAFAPGCFRS